MSEFIDKDISIGDKYGPAMEIKTQADADAYFEQCVKHSMVCWGQSREDAECTERANLGYYAGYYNQETRERIEELFHCEHPFFGKAKNNPLTPEQQLKIGFDLGAKLRG